MKKAHNLAMPVRMKDIARDLGVSVVTVSKVLRNHDDISEETRQKVLKRMKELNYRPNLAARALVTGRSFIMGLVVPDLLHPFCGEVAKGISGALRKKGYGLVIASSEEDSELEQQEIEQLLARRVDALLVASAQWTVESFRRVEEHKIPYVLLDRKFLGLAANFVGVDDELAGLLATDHLFDAGCRRIAHIGGPQLSTAVGRLEGYRQAHLRRGILLNSAYIVNREQADESGDISGYQAMKKLLEADPRPDGVFCYNDPAAIGAMMAILEAGLRIPEDIAVIGCGNVRYGEFLRVPLSTVDQNSEQIGLRAAELALEVVESKAAPRPKIVMVEPKLVVRQSSDRKAARGASVSRD
jgi:LacI family transcriptional regulator